MTPSPEPGASPVACLLARYPVPSETFIRREIRALAETGIDVRVFALRREAEAATCGEPEFRGSVPGSCPAALRLAVLRAAWPVLGSCLREPGTLARVLRNLPCAAAFAARCRALGVSRVHAHFATLPADLGLVVARALNVPFSFSGHAGDLFLQDRRRLACKLRHADFATACTARGRERLVAVAPDAAGKILLVRHGLFPEEWPATSPAGAGEIVAVGRLVEKKGFSVLLRACALLRRRGTGFRLRVAGDGPERPRLEVMTRDLGLADRVIFLGALPEEKVGTLLRSAAVFAQPSVEDRSGDTDGLPNALLEAMATGLAVVASDLAAIPEAVTDGQTGLLAPPGDAAALADRLGALIAAPDLRARLGAAARARVLRDFDQRALIGNLVAGMRRDTCRNH